ncbi:MAG TPA: SPFH domain-containing protein [Myxococcales bacterium]|jgi:membrane protease subunit HflK
MKPSDRVLRASLTSIGIDLVLISTKAALSALTGSLALAADAWHSLSDLVVSLTVLASILLKRRAEVAPAAMAAPGIGALPPAPPSGGRLESGIAYLVSLAILYVPYEIVTSIRASAGRPLSYAPVAVVGLLFCILLSWLAARLKLGVGNETGSKALSADGWHSWTDMLSTVAVLASVMGTLAGIELDGLVAVGIAVLIGVTGLEMLATSIVGLVRGSAPASYSLLGLLTRPGRERVDVRPPELGPGDEPPAPSDPPAPPARLPSPLQARRLALVVLSASFMGWLATGLAPIGPDEVGLRLRFGARVGPELEPGLHALLPWPIETVERVSRSMARLEVGFRSVAGAPSSELLWDGTRAGAGGVRVDDESLALTGDEAALAFSFVLHYRPSDPVRFAVRSNGVDHVLRSLADARVREVLASEPVDALLTADRAEFLERVRSGIDAAAKRLDLGVEVVSVLCRELHPPFDTVAAFRDAFSAREDQLKLLNQAESYQNEALPRSRGEQARRLGDARAYALERSTRAEGDARRFTLQAEAERASPDLTRERLFLETLEVGLAGKRKIVASPKVNRGGYHLWLFAPDQAPAPAPEPRPVARPPAASPLPPPPLPSPEE